MISSPFIKISSYCLLSDNSFAFFVSPGLSYTYFEVGISNHYEDFSKLINYYITFEYVTYDLLIQTKFNQQLY